MPSLQVYRDGATRDFEDIASEWDESFILATRDFVEAVREGRDAAEKRIDAETKERERVEGELATANRLIDCLDSGMKKLEDRMDRRERGYIGRAIDRARSWRSR